MDASNEESMIESTSFGASPLPGLIAGSFAMSAFAIAIVAGLGGSNDALTVLSRAVTVLLISYPVGLVAGTVVSKVVRDHVKTLVATRPIPELETVMDDIDDDGVIDVIPVDEIETEAATRQAA